jgi:hypothetical protein
MSIRFSIGRLLQRAMPLLALVLLAASIEAQQSYRSYQRLSGHVLSNAAQTEKNKSLNKGLSLRFRGWKHTGKFSAKYSAHFSRPRARAARAELLKNVARKAAQQKPFASARFAPSQLPGILLRDSLPTGFIPSAVATADFNGDGNLDFVVANGGDNTLWLYYGNGNGTFSLPTIVPVTLGQSPVWIATGDLRGIGRTDIVVAEADSNSVGIFLNSGNGTFVESAVALPNSATCVLVADFNNDGKLDIAAPMNDENAENNFNVYIATLPGLGNGSFGTPVITTSNGYVPYIIYGSVADLNGDGKPDLLLIDNGLQIQDVAAQVFLSNGDGTFTAGQVVAQASPASLPTASALFDADGQGNLDAVLTDASGTLWVYHGNGDGTFSTNPEGAFQMGDAAFDIGVADVNGDGILDVVVSGALIDDSGLYGTPAGDQICVLLGDGKGNFGAPTAYRGDSSSYSLVVGNFGGSALPDVVTANQDNDSATVFLNDGSGGFGAPSGKWVGYEGAGTINAPTSGVLTADVDKNGSTDVAFLEIPSPFGTDTYYQLTVLLNDGNGNLSPPIRSDATDAFTTDWVLADFRNTGYPDFISISTNDTGSSYDFFAPNSGAGKFGPPTQTNLANAIGVIGVGDFNGDGKLDFVAAGLGINNSRNGIAVFLGNGDGTFRTGYTQNFGGTTPNPVAVYVGDFNRDGKLDLLVFLEGNQGFIGSTDVYEFLGNGDGTFQAGTIAVPNIGSMIVGDLNGDGYPDIVGMPVQNISQLVGTPIPVQFSIYIGQPDGTFQLTNTYAPYLGASVLPLQGDVNYAPMLADFNGDGNLDIAAFQKYGANPAVTATADTFVQFLLGNGDGTFTPTYEVFDFRKPSVNVVAADLLGSGAADLFELDGYRSTYQVLTNEIAPAFQFALLEDPVPPTQGSGIILLDVPVSTATTVSLTASDPAIQVPSTVTVPAGSISQEFAFNIGAAFNTQHGFSITAKSGSTSATVIGTVSGSAVFQTSGAMTVSLAAGQTDSTLGQVITSVNGYSGTVSMQCLGLSAVGQCTFTPSSLTVHPGQTSDGALSFSALANVAQGTYSGTLRTTDGATIQNAPLTINIGDYTMSLSPQTLQLLPDGSGTYQLTVGSINQFNQIVNLTCSGLPTGASCSTFPGYARPPTGSSPVSIPVQLQSVPTGNYTITVSGSSPPVAHAATAQLQVWDFTPSVSPTGASTSAGGIANFNVTVSAVNGFNGSVSFSCSGSGASAVSCSFNPGSTNVSANANATSVLTVTAPSQPAATSLRHTAKSTTVTFGALGLLLMPLGLFIRKSKSGKKRVLTVFVVATLIGLPGCGSGGSSSGGGGGGGGGGGHSQTYSIQVNVNSGSTYTKSAGMITLTVN